MLGKMLDKTTKVDLDDDVHVHPCRNGRVAVVRARGDDRLVAAVAFAAGEVLFRMEGLTTRSPSRFTLQVDDRLHLRPGESRSPEEALERYYWKYMNHSCDPSVWVRGREVIALRPIRPGESLTFDYNTTEYDMAEPFSCRCGSVACAGLVRGFRHLTLPERERLRPLLSPHLARRLGAAAAATTDLSA
jgi:SET domain